MTVSVVIPLYNKVAHIARAIECVLAQSCADFELLVVDDGSTDGSADVVRRYADARIRLVVQANAGVSAARNRGVAEARFDLVAFLDADDEWRPDFLESVLRLRDRFPQAAVWATAYSVVATDGKSFQPEFLGTAAAGATGGLIDFFQSGDWKPVHASAFMVQKDALVRAGGFPVAIRIGEDWDTWMRLALRYPIAWLPQAKCVVYQDAENRTDMYCNTGVGPFMRSMQAFVREAGPGVRLDAYVCQHVAQCHMRFLYGNWLAGDRAAMAEILRDCRGIKGIRTRRLVWSCLRWAPNCLVLASWRLRQWLAGRPTDPPSFRSIVRGDRAH